MTKIELQKVDDLEAQFDDITGLEEWREYIFSDGVRYRIDNPVKIFVKRTEGKDSHRLIDADGIRYYIPPGWIAFSFKGKWGKS